MGIIKAEFDETSKRIPEGSGFALDLGSGDQPYRVAIEEKGYKYIGVDISPKNNSKDLIVADAHYLPFKDNTFELIFNSHFLEHVLEPKKVIKEMKRTMKLNKYCITLVPFMTPGHGDDYWRFSIRGLNYMFRDFEIVETIIPTHVFTKVGHFINHVLYHYNLKKLGGIMRDFFSQFDKYLSKVKNFDAWAHSYIIVCKKNSENKNV